LCHSVQGTFDQLMGYLGEDPCCVAFTCAGVNHMAFYLRLEHEGRNLYPQLHDLADAGKMPAFERVRFEVFRRFGYFVTESSEHFSEYVPWFIKQDRPDLIDAYNVPLDEYPARCEEQIGEWGRLRDALYASDPEAIAQYEGARGNKLSGMWERRLAAVTKADPAMAEGMREQAIAARQQKFAGHSGEYGTLIIHSMETGQPRVVYGNVMNDGLIDNLPAESCVEVPCLVDANGVQPTHVGRLPVQLAALMQTNINVQALTVEAALTGRREHIRHAAMVDPHTAAELDLDQIHALVDELIEAHGDFLPAYQ